LFKPFQTNLFLKKSLGEPKIKEEVPKAEVDSSPAKGQARAHDHLVYAEHGGGRRGIEFGILASPRLFAEILGLLLSIGVPEWLRFRTCFSLQRKKER
jgi:hypothetical protein